MTRNKAGSNAIENLIYNIHIDINNTEKQERKRK